MSARGLGLRAAFAFALVGCLAPHARADADGDAGSGESAKAASALPASLRPSVKTMLAPHAIAVGEVAKLTIEVDAPTALGVSLPEQPFGGLELADRRLRTEPQGERTRTVYELDLIAFEPGRVEIPALSLRLVGPNGELDEAKTDPQTLTVSSLIVNEPNAAPKPATKPVTVMQDDFTLAWVGLGVLGVALTAAATVYISRWLRNRPKAPVPPPPPRPAWELALERLHALEREKTRLFAAGRAEEFVDGVSDALREYLGRRYGFDGLERTTAELVHTLEELKPPRLSLAGVSALLEQCDLVKFARAVPEPEECQDLWNGAIGLVRATTPSLPPPPPPASMEART